MPSTSVRNPKKRSANASGVIRQLQPPVASSSSGDNLQADLVEQEAGKRKKRPSPLLPPGELPKEMDKLSISDLLPEDQIWALKNTVANATETIRTRTIKVASSPWQDYTEYRRMALNTPDELTSVPKSELHKIFRDDQHQFTTSNEVISGMLLRQVVSAIAVHLQLDPSLVEVIVFQHIQVGKDDRLESIEALVDHLINSYCAASQVQASWAVNFFVGRCQSFVKGNGKSNWCKGLIPFLRQHLTWQDNSKCDDWIQSLETYINKQSESNDRNAMSVCTKLMDAFAMKNPNTIAPSMLPKRYYNAGAWIRL